MNPLDDDMAFQRRRSHEERRAVLEAALRARGFTPEDAQIHVAEYTVGVLNQAVDMTFDPAEPYFGWVRKEARKGWWWRGLLSARHEIQRLEQVEHQRIHNLVKAKHKKEDERP